MDSDDLLYLEEVLTETEPDIQKLIAYYTDKYSDQADWKVIEDLQIQAMVYTNIIEQIKWGGDASDIRERIEGLGLVPEGILPNPDSIPLLNHAFGKISKLRQLMVNFVKNRGGSFIGNLSIELVEVNITAGLGIELGFPPAISLNFEPTIGFEGSWSQEGV